MSIDYYDKVLAGISGSLAVGTAAGLLTSMPVPYGVGAGAAVSIAIMYHGMFRNAPEGGR